jgi:hypothetical protein
MSQPVGNHIGGSDAPHAGLAKNDHGPVLFDPVQVLAKFSQRNVQVLEFRHLRKLARVAHINNQGAIRHAETRRTPRR